MPGFSIPARLAQQSCAGRLAPRSSLKITLHRLTTLSFLWSDCSAYDTDNRMFFSGELVTRARVAAESTQVS
jgi:hypothetical protein